MVTSKLGSTKPHCMVDMSSLKKASYRLTHSGAPPFLEVQNVPPGTFKTVTDPWQGCQWGMDHVSMDAYNYRFDKITEKVTDKKRCVDDSLLYSLTLKNAFFKTANYLTLMGENPEKFQFGRKQV